MNGRTRGRVLRLVLRLGVATLLVSLLAFSGTLAEGPANMDEPEANALQGARLQTTEWPLEVGVEYIQNYPGTSSDLPNADDNAWGLYNSLRARGWCNASWADCFIWYNQNAWEQDFKRVAAGGTTTTG